MLKLILSIIVILHASCSMTASADNMLTEECELRKNNVIAQLTNWVENTYEYNKDKSDEYVKAIDEFQMNTQTEA